MDYKSNAANTVGADIGSYEGRLATFDGLTSATERSMLIKHRHWPETAAVEPSKLARAGFFLNANFSHEADDTVECFACHRRLSNWKFNDSVLRRHLEACATCPFLSKIMPSDQPVTLVEIVGPSSHAAILQTRSSRAVSSTMPTNDCPMEVVETDGRNRAQRPSQANASPDFAGVTLSALDVDLTAATTHGNIFTRMESTLLDADDSSVRRPTNTLRNMLSSRSVIADPAAMIGVDDSPDLFDDDARQKPEYFNHDARLRSFSSHNQPWPISHIVPADLAEAGFFYTGEMDKVQCAFCSGVLSRFQPGDNAWNEHVKFYPTCPLVRNRLAAARSSLRRNNNIKSRAAETQSGVVENIPRITVRRNSEDGLNDDFLGSDAIGHDVAGIYADTMANAELADRPQVLSRHHSHRASSPPASDDLSDEELGILSNCPKRPDLATVDARIATFTVNSPTGAFWPQHDVRQTPSELAEAGLYYIGTRDCTKCFFCDGTLNGWQSSDDPFIEHARFYQNCGYLLSVKGRPFIEAAVANHCPTSHSPPMSRQHSTLKPIDQQVISTVLASPTSASSSSTETEKFISSFNQRLRVPDRFVQQARQLGFTDLSIRRAIELLSREQIDRSITLAAPASGVANATGIQGDETVVLTTFGPLLQHILRDAERASNVANASGSRKPLFDRFNSDPTGASKNGRRPLDASAAQDRKMSLGDDAVSVPPPVPQSQPNNLSATLPATTCKICMDREVGVAFLPCSHLVSCAYCAPALKFCPVCRSPIKKIFKTYLS